jgi:predicted nucleic acid-binding protein
VSFQVLQEFYANFARKWPKSVASARHEVLGLLAWQPIKIDSEILKLGWKVQDRYGISFWDALIVAAAKGSSCEFLLSEDFQAGPDFGGLRIVNPFRADPHEIL